MTAERKRKLEGLKKIVRKMRSAVIAFSGGLDSTFLLRVALDELGKENVLAVTARSESFPKREYESARGLARGMGARFMTINTRELEIGSFASNPVDRCYYCKKELFTRLIKIAKSKNMRYAADGYNHDDKSDLRYGSLAARELGIRSPLAEAKIGKQDIRNFSRKIGLPTWDKPSFACLASRFPYHSKITKSGLRRVDKAEDYLHQCGFRQARVRTHGDVARIEVCAKDIPRVLRIRKKIGRRLKTLGFLYVALDLEGYRTGSMNEGLPKVLTK